jgi:hypothetical protein
MCDLKKDQDSTHNAPISIARNRNVLNETFNRADKQSCLQSAGCYMANGSLCYLPKRLPQLYTPWAERTMMKIL